MAEVIEVEIEQASEQEQRGREDEVALVLSRLRRLSGIRVLAKHLWQIAIFKSPWLKISRIAGQAKKIENSDNLLEKPLWGTTFEKNIFNFQESIVFEKMRKNENSGFYLFNYAKIRVKMSYFIASLPREDSKL